jgi:splicing factor, arginine/serine-rich 18
LPPWIREGLEKMEREKSRKEEREKAELEREESNKKRLLEEQSLLDELKSGIPRKSKFVSK